MDDKSHTRTTPINEITVGAALMIKDAEIEDLRKALAFTKAQRDHWHGLVPAKVRVKFPFQPDSQ